MTFTPLGVNKRVTLKKSIESRELNPDDADLRDNLNNDVDMLQRAMIQVFGLDKGRLSNYQIGQYQDNRGNQFYQRTPPNSPWSKIADEVWNFDKFVLNTRRPSYNCNLRVVQGIWEQFGLILAAGNIGSVNRNHPNFDQWMTNAVNNSGLMVPQGFPGTAKDVIDGIIKNEDGRDNPRHSFPRFNPLAVSSVRVGEVRTGQGTPRDHTYTDWGIGFGAVQPYNAGGRNLYLPEQNLTRVGEWIHGLIRSVPRAVTGAKARVWHAAFAYNQGSMQANRTPANLRNAGSDGAAYADGVFDFMGINPPDLNTD